MSQLVRLEGKHTAQTAHCAVVGKVWTGKRQVEDCESWGGDVLVVSEDKPSIFCVSGLFSGENVLLNFNAVKLTQWKK